MLVKEWDVPEADKALIDRIVSRALAAGVGFKTRDTQELLMDVTYVHRNIFELRLADWLAAEFGDFYHDINGIRRHLNRREGTLGRCFVPRFARRERKVA